MDTNKGDWWMPNETETNENTKVDTQVQEKEASSKTETQADKALSLEDALTRIEKLEGINKEVITDRDKVKNKLREIEKVESDSEETRLKEQGEYKELLDKEKERSSKLESSIRDREVGSVLKDSLRESGLSEDAINTAVALVDKTKISYDLDNGVDKETITSSIDALKTEHGILFSAKPKTPAVKRAADRTDQDTYESELVKLRTGGSRRDLEALRAKYNR